MRLTQLGLKAYVVGEPTAPSIDKKDLLVVVSGSGKTETVYDILQEARKKKAETWCITANKSSKIAKKSQHVILIPAKSKYSHKKSIQPLDSSFEQTTRIFLDAVILMLMKKTRKNEKDLAKRHTTLE